MTISNRNVTIKSIFATNANTTIPSPPIAGASYRNESVTTQEIAAGWPFKEIVDSAKFNEAMYEYTTICKLLEQYGFLPWSPYTDYPAQGCALGSDGKIYQAKSATGPSSTAVDPVTDTSHNTWDLFYYSSVTANRALVSNSSGKMAASSTTATELGYVHGVTSAIQTQINNKANNNAVVHLTGNETITGTKTFSETSSGANLVQSTSGTVGGTWIDFVQQINGARRGTMRTMYNSDGSYQVTFGCNGPNAEAAVGLTVKRTASSTTVTAPTPTTTTDTDSKDVATTGWVNSTGNNVVHRSGNETIAGTKTFSAVAYGHASSQANSLLTTIDKLKAANGYYKLGNGLIIQWFSIGTGTNFSVTFPTPFSSATSYSVASGTSYNSGGETWALNIKNRTSTGFTGLLDGRYDGAMCIAIGY